MIWELLGLSWSGVGGNLRAAAGLELVDAGHDLGAAGLELVRCWGELRAAAGLELVDAGHDLGAAGFELDGVEGGGGGRAAAGH